MLKINNNPMLKFSLIPLAAIVLGFFVAALISLAIVRSSINKDYQNQRINNSADSLKLRLDQSQQNLIRQAQSMAASIQLSELVTNGDSAARSLEQARLREMIPYARSVRLFRAGEAKPNPDAFPPFKFQSLDMVNRTEQGETVYPEAINADGLWIVALAAPIRTPSNNTIYGSLFIYYDINIFSEALTESIEGKLRLVQTFSSAPGIEILSAGQSNNTNIIKRKLANPNWHIDFSPSDSLLNSEIEGVGIFLIPSFLSLIITLAGVMFGLQRLLVGLKSDTRLVINQMADVINSQFTNSSNYTHAEFLEIDATLSRMGKKEKLRKEVAPLNVTAIPQPSAEVESIELGALQIDDEADEFSFEEKAPDIEDPVEIEEDIEEVDVSSIFRAYDIRGIVGETLTSDIVMRIGQAIGTQAGEIGEQTLVVGADGRLSSPEFSEALIEGLCKSGRDVINLGSVPTPLLYFATHLSEARSGVMITGSHSAADYNGLKIVFNGQALVDDEIQALYRCYLSKDFSEGEGEVSELDMREEYIDTIADDVVVAQPLKVIVDCGNGIAGEILPDLIHNLGCEVIPLYCDVDGNFPNHHPDPINPDNLQDLILMVKSQEADLGIALDGDGDRLVAITKDGDIVWPDRLLMLFAKDVVSRNPGSDVVYDVKCTRHLNSVISGFGGRPLICRSGHSFIKAKMLETDAILGGEMSGHICFKERWYGFDDGIYAAARLLEVVGSQPEGLAELLSEFPTSVSTPEITIGVPESHKFDLIQQIIENADFEGATITKIDGLRVDFSDSWGLVRASNTSPCLTLRFEADNKDSLLNIQALFRDELASINEGLSF
ncbi:MAG: phosphomannomutase/phosphoglucomutase [Candidatus Azotimanducaceae bacterium]|jgi:phosphomannomutase/phosphoglucomutase